MREKNIPITDHMIFHGDYWRDKGEEAVDWFMYNRETYPEAIVCANDYMAISVCEEQAATLSKCVEIADRRMYEDKRARKNCRK